MYRLLIADDEMIELKILRRTLEENLGDQCVVFEAENGREALEIYEREKIQIAILDIEMPGINGIDAAAAIRAEDKECCIIFLTAFDEFAYAKGAISVRALDYLLKPFDEQELLLVLEEAMRQIDEREWRRKQWEKLELDEEREAREDIENARTSKVTEEIYAYIRKNYQKDLSMQDVARVMNYSEAYFSRLFKQNFGKNFTAYLTEYRVNEAKKLLAQPTINVKEVGKAVGYGDSNYFTKVFKRITGQSPTEYRGRLYQQKD
ncbi:MAG: response regulator [Clostridiales bacterium]|nr:response regulator [Clostridiales bacterium]